VSANLSPEVAQNDVYKNAPLPVMRSVTLLSPSPVAHDTHQQITAHNSLDQGTGCEVPEFFEVVKGTATSKKSRLELEAWNLPR